MGTVRVVAAAAALLTWTGCQTTPQPGASQGAGDSGGPVRAYVVHHVEHAFKSLARDFERETGIPVEATYACRRNLYNIVKEKSDGDLYVDSRHENLEQAGKDGLACGALVPVGELLPVIEVAKGNPKRIKELADLARSGVRVCLGAKAACMGRVAEGVLKKNGLAEKVTPNVVKHVVGEQNIAKSVDGKDVDATIIWLSTVRELGSAKVETVAIPAAQNLIDKIEATVLKTGKNRAGAEKLAEFLCGSGARKVLAEAGLSM